MRARRMRRRHFFFYVQHRGNAASFCWLLALCVAAALGLVLVDASCAPRSESGAESRARYLATQVINEAIGEELEENAAEYADLLRLEEGEDRPGAGRADRYSGQGQFDESAHCGAHRVSQKLTRSRAPSSSACLWATP